MATTLKTGVSTLEDLLAHDDTYVLDFGEDTVAQVVARDLELFNAEVADLNRLLTEPVTTLAGRMARYGTSIRSRMTRLDELGRSTTKRTKPGENVGFPMYKFGDALSWTYDYLAQATVRDLALGVIAIEEGYLLQIQREVQRAIYLSANYTQTDEFAAPIIDLPVKRFVNADSAKIPDGPNGEEFDGATHTHYNANNGWDNAALLASIADLTEHGHTDGVKLAINAADETAVRALTDFEPYRDPRIDYRATDTATMTVDLSNTGDRAIGIFGQAEVWVKPWALDNYPFLFAADDPGKPLKLRQHHVARLRGLRLVAQNDAYPLRADHYEAYFGVGVWTRTNGVILYVGNGTYADPTIPE